jgi:hypothetical protein
MNYSWDIDFVDVPKDVPCKCGSKLCRKLLLIARGLDRSKAKQKNFHKDHWALI